MRQAKISIFLREILATISAGAITLFAFLFAIAFGVFISGEIANGSWLVGMLASVGFLLFVVLPLRLWWVMKRG